MDEPTAWQDLGNRLIAQAGSGSSTQSVSLAPTERPCPGIPETREQCRALRAWARSQPASRPTTASRDQIEQHLEFLAATLPSKAIDTETGKRRFAVYVSLLDGLSNKALVHMSRRACETLDWFPTPKQCLELAREWTPGRSEAAQALLDCDHYDQAAFDLWIAALPTGGEIGDAPQRWIDIAVARNAIRRAPDGALTIRRTPQKDMAA